MSREIEGVNFSPFPSKIALTLPAESERSKDSFTMHICCLISDGVRLERHLGVGRPEHAAPIQQRLHHVLHLLEQVPHRRDDPLHHDHRAERQDPHQDLEIDTVQEEIRGEWIDRLIELGGILLGAVRTYPALDGAFDRDIFRLFSGRLYGRSLARPLAREAFCVVRTHAVGTAV